jgi:hypothetical protein
MVGRLFIAGAVLASVLRVGGANADPQPEPMLVPPVSPACISSPFGPRVLANHPQAGTPTIMASIYRRRRARRSWQRRPAR